MRKVYPYSVYHYEVVGAEEEEAAYELDRALDFLYHSNMSGEDFLVELETLRCRTAEKYGVEIKAVVK